MKKFILLLLVIAVALLAWSSFAPSHAQDSANEEKPTFYRLVPGVYVNGYPRFTVRYPKDWLERPIRWHTGEFFRVSPPGPDRLPTFRVQVSVVPFPLDKFADSYVPFFKRLGATEVTVVSDKPSQLRDGTPAREVEFQAVFNGIPYNVVYLATRKGDFLITTSVVTPGGKLGEDLKAILNSIEFEPGKDEPVKVPPDVQEFLERCSSATVAHDVAQVMAYYSDRYLNSGTRKGEMERFQKMTIGRITSFEIVITDFIPAGDKAYLTGFVINNFGKFQIFETSIIKENGEWKWHGNQRDPAP